MKIYRVSISTKAAFYEKFFLSLESAKTFMMSLGLTSIMRQPSLEEIEVEE